MTAALLAGCADSSRFLGDPLGNPFKSASSDVSEAQGADLAPPSYSPMHTGSISSRPLAPPPDMPSRHVASYEAAPHESPRLAQSYAVPSTDRTASIAAPSGHGSWTTTGGMSIIAGTGDTAGILAERYNVPTETLLRVNGLSAGDVRPGTRLVIPVYSATAAAPSRMAKVEKIEKVEKVAKSEKVEHKPHDHSSRERLLAKHETPEPEKMHWVKGPSPAKVAEADKHAHDKPEVRPDHKKRTAESDDDAAPAPAPMKTAKAGAAPKTAVADKKADTDKTPTASLPPADDKVAESDAPEFRWPAHGRIIQGFKTGGNDGINIAVPEGTSVKAAESGVVAYAGSEIKGFGNLVLIRHPNGYVTAYANNSDIEVHRGEQVKRGQVIAKSGQSGNVASPQLHFELRKGSTPVDPTRYLAGL